MDSFAITGPKFTDGKPLWRATAKLVNWHYVDDDKDFKSSHLQVRHLFLKETEGKKMLPGTMLALCRIEKVEVKLQPSNTFAWEEHNDIDIDDGKDVERICHALLLLEAVPKDQSNFPDCVCVGGEIDLNLLVIEDSEKEKLATHLSPLKINENVVAHAGGLTFGGSVNFPWQKQAEIKGAFLASVPFGDAETDNDKRFLRVTLDRELMKDAEFKSFGEAFRRLEKMLKNEPLNNPTDDLDELYWASLELVSESVAPLFYLFLRLNDFNRSKIGFERGEWQLLVSDQTPGESDVTPRSLLSFSPVLELPLELAAGNKEIKIEFDEGEQKASEAKFTLSAEKKNEKWSETITLENLATGYDALETADLLRRQHQVISPDDAARRGDEPAILWGFMPVEDGWAQMPFLNLTEQIYFDALAVEGKSLEDDAGDGEKSPLLVGAATFGNDAPETYRPADGKHPWSVTLLNGAGVSGVWTINLNDKNLISRKLEVFAPDVVLNGFLRLGLEPPTTADALPSLDNWVAGLHTISLRTLPAEKSEPKTPSPFCLRFPILTFENRRMKDKIRDFSAPDLKDWEFIYETNQREYARPEKRLFELLLSEEGFWRGIKKTEVAERRKNLWQYKPLVWRKHPTAPLIQSLPLTQNQVPPNYPSPNRQLAPFELSVTNETNPLPENWNFGVKSGAGAHVFPKYLPEEIAVSGEWKMARYLPLASLGLPGLIFDPCIETANAPIKTDFLPAQMLHGLPFTDEVNALAQLPKNEENRQAVSPTQDAMPKKPLPALRRETLAEFWKSLSEKAELAKTDADEVLHKKGEKIFARGLVEPFNWKVTATLDVKNFPHSLTLENVESSADGKKNALKLTAPPDAAVIEKNPQIVSALQGISGKFSLNESELKLENKDFDGYEIVAGSLAARLEKIKEGGKEKSFVRDQRGWRRDGANKENDILLKTEIQSELIAGQIRSFNLCSLLKSVTLKLETGEKWDFWFGNLPVNSAGNIFSRSETRNEIDNDFDNEGKLDKTAEDVNDPAANSKFFAALSAYEWRLNDEVEGNSLSLFNFDFFPLTLEKVVLDGAGIIEIEIIGRIQLSNEKPDDEPENGNAVCLNFKRNAAGDLDLLSISSTLNEKGEMTGGVWRVGAANNRFAPRLRWSKLNYKKGGEFVLNAALEFYLFDVRWSSLPVRKEIKFKPNEPLKLKYLKDELKPTGDENLRFVEIDLRLGDTLKLETLNARLHFDWGGFGDAALRYRAETNFDLKADKTATKVSLLTGRIKEPNGEEKDLEIPLAAKNSSLVTGALQIEFDGFGDKKSYYLLPGMQVDGKSSCRGFAAMSFTVDAENQKMQAGYGAAEAIFSCRWGASLQQREGNDAIKQIFGSSAGEVYAGYTLTGGADEKWSSSLLLNGVLEVKNLISYPQIETAALPADPLRVRFKQKGDDIVDIIAADAPILDQVVGHLRKNPALYLSVEGHADESGEHDDNNDLSKDRAEAVKKELEKRLLSAGVSESLIKNRIIAVGFGATMPRDDIKNGRNNNRRVEFHPTFGAIPKFDKQKLNHVRHTMRVLLNQHDVPTDALRAGGDSILLNFANDAAWQFLAVVEHQLSDVDFPAVKPESKNERRWTVVQEVRLMHPKKFADLLKKFNNESIDEDNQKIKIETKFPTHTVGKDFELRDVSAAFQYRKFLEIILTPRNEIENLRDSLLIEASAVFQILDQPRESADYTNLQYLPGSIQQAVLSIPADFAAPRVSEKYVRDWLLLALPFLGRLQSEAQDFPQTADGKQNVDSQSSLLQIDPIYFLANSSKNPIPSLPLALTSRGANKDVPVRLSHFDLPRFRRFRRLEPTTIEENWFRLHHPPSEDLKNNPTTKTAADKKLLSVTASLPADSPGRLSRSAALSNLFASLRRALPPKPGGKLIENPKPTDPLEWREDSIFTAQGYSDLLDRSLPYNNSAAQIYSFYFTGAQICLSGLPTKEKGIARFAAVTILPAALKDNRQPVGFAVSPYLGLTMEKLKDTQPKTIPELLVAELLCLGQAGKTLEIIATRVWQRDELITQIKDFNDPDKFIGEILEKWSLETHDRLAADSPLIILRTRKILAVIGGVRIDYGFSVFESLAPALRTLKGAGALRLPLEKMRFAESNFGGKQIPAKIQNFELAPPQVRGTQPIYIDPANPLSENPALKWNWGISALRFGVQFARGGRGITGAVSSAGGHLWWSAISHQVQFALPPQTGKLLPAKFRARFIRSLSPTAPRLPLPEDLEEFLRDNNSVSPEFNLWQPVLPGAVSYLLTGARAGAPFAFRHLLLRQKINAENLKENESKVNLSSDSIPVQHRFPRPVSLPKLNGKPTESAPADALQTWASYFEPRKNQKITRKPTDNAFIVKDKNEAHGLEITLEKPVGGVLSLDTLGDFRLKLAGKAMDADYKHWNIEAELTTGNRRLKLTHLKDAHEDKAIYWFYHQPPDIQLGENADERQRSEGTRSFLANLPHGAPLNLIVKAIPPENLIDGIKGFSQSLSFPLRLAQTGRLLEPFQYVFAQFEDPEYNRRLVTPAAQTSRVITKEDKSKSVEMLLAGDRRQYNPASALTILLYCDDRAVKDEEAVKVSGVLTLSRLDASGTPSELKLPLETAKIESRRLKTIPLGELKTSDGATLVPGDLLLITFTPGEPSPAGFITVPPLEMRVDIVAAPVTPAPTAAYALLRQSKNEANEAVECSRFAWAAQPARVELLNPVDLITGEVRRRAVFQWLDTVRHSMPTKHAIQKIAASGSTHFVKFD